MARKYTSTINVSPYNVGSAQPLDVRMVVEFIDDLKPASLLKTTYIGMIVYVLEDSSLYVCYNKPTRATQSLTNVEDGWRKIDIDYSVRIVESESNLTDGTTIMFPYQGMMAYVTSESALYILLTKGVENAKDINNWKKIIVTSSASLIDKIGINTEPEGGSGFKITENKKVIIEDYINVENYIKAGYNDPDNSLGLSELSGNIFVKETPVCFGIDIQFTDGWTISYGDVSRPFVDSDYYIIDVYRSEYSPEVYAYLKGIDIRVLTEDDLTTIDDKIDNLANTMMIDLGDSSEPGGSDGSDIGGSTPVPLKQVIVNMNNSIDKLEQQIKVEPETINNSDIEQLFS